MFVFEPRLLDGRRRMPRLLQEIYVEHKSRLPVFTTFRLPDEVTHALLESAHLRDTLPGIIIDESIASYGLRRVIPQRKLVSPETNGGMLVPITEMQAKKLAQYVTPKTLPNELWVALDAIECNLGIQSMYPPDGGHDNGAAINLHIAAAA